MSDKNEYWKPKNGMVIKNVCDTARDRSELADTAGYVKMPSELTAENGAKYHLIGEFHEAVTMTCHDCGGEGDIDGEPCEECDSVGTFVVKVPIHWTTIKEIYAKAVEHLSKT